jgi:hypothetical protein
MGNKEREPIIIPVETTAENALWWLMKRIKSECNELQNYIRQMKHSFNKSGLLHIQQIQRWGVPVNLWFKVQERKGGVTCHTF